LHGQRIYAEFHLTPCNSGDCSITKLVSLAAENAPVSWFLQATGIAFDNDTMLDVLGAPLPGVSSVLSAALTIPYDDGMLMYLLPNIILIKPRHIFSDSSFHWREGSGFG
jgi:hypothetical protein